MLGMKSLLHRGCSHYRVGSPRENGKAAIALSPRPHDIASMLQRQAFNYLVVADEGDARLVRVALPELGTTLYVGKEECYRAGWQVGHIHSHNHDHFQQ